MFTFFVFFASFQIWRQFFQHVILRDTIETSGWLNMSRGFDWNVTLLRSPFLSRRSSSDSMALRRSLRSALFRWRSRSGEDWRLYKIKTVTRSRSTKPCPSEDCGGRKGSVSIERKVWKSIACQGRQGKVGQGEGRRDRDGKGSTKGKGRGEGGRRRRRWWRWRGKPEENTRELGERVRVWRRMQTTSTGTTWFALRLRGCVWWTTSSSTLSRDLPVTLDRYLPLPKSMFHLDGYRRLFDTPKSSVANARRRWSFVTNYWPIVDWWSREEFIRTFFLLSFFLFVFVWIYIILFDMYRYIRGGWEGSQSDSK